MPTLSEIPVASWEEFRSSFDWRQGQHLTCIGATGSGKTTLLSRLLADARSNRTHPWQILVATKRKDEILDEFKDQGFQKITNWTVSDPQLTPKVMLAPPLPNAREKDRQREAIRDALNGVYHQGGWLILLDELKHIANYLGLESEVELLLHQGRSAGITVVGGVQRPRHVPLMAYDQATHLFMFENRDQNIRKRLGEIGGKVDPAEIEHGVSNLPDHSFLYVNPTTGEMIQSKVEL